MVGGHKVTSAPHVLPLLVGLRVDRTLWQTRESFPIPAKLQAHAGVGMLARRETYDDGTCIEGCYTGDWTLGALAEAGVAIGVLGLYGDRWGVEFLLGPTLLGDTTKEGAGLEVYADMGISLLWLSRHNHQWSLQSHLLVGPGSATDTIGDDKVTAFALVTCSL